MDKRRLIGAFAKYGVNPVIRRAGGRIPPWTGWILIETIGRRTGLPRTTPVGGRRDKDAVWVVAEHGRRADYVRNLEAKHEVRVMVGGRWRTGVAEIVEGADPREEMRRQNPLNAAGLRLISTDPLVIRVDLTE